MLVDRLTISCHATTGRQGIGPRIWWTFGMGHFGGVRAAQNVLKFEFPERRYRAYLAGFLENICSLAYTGIWANRV